jgi:hypothetical protein
MGFKEAFKGQSPTAKAITVIALAIAGIVIATIVIVVSVELAKDSARVQKLYDECVSEQMQIRTVQDAKDYCQYLKDNAR